MKNKYSKLPLFLILAWIFAFIYEEIPRLMLRNIGTQHLWELGKGWLLFFLIWYGTIFLICYFLFINKPLKYALVYGLLYGLIFETFYFKKMQNIFSLIIFILIYLGVFYFPFKIHKILYNKEKITKLEIWGIVITQLLALSLLALISLAA